MSKFHYTTLTNSTLLKDQVLDLIGNDGHELVNVLYDVKKDEWVYFFKKEIKE